MRPGQSPALQNFEISCFSALERQGTASVPSADYFSGIDITLFPFPAPLERARPNAEAACRLTTVPSSVRAPWRPRARPVLQPVRQDPSASARTASGPRAAPDPVPSRPGGPRSPPMSRPSPIQPRGQPLRTDSAGAKRKRASPPVRFGTFRATVLPYSGSARVLSVKS